MQLIRHFHFFIYDDDPKSVPCFPTPETKNKKNISLPCVINVENAIV